jgi:hypothetical protein
MIFELISERICTIFTLKRKVTLMISKMGVAIHEFERLSRLGTQKGKALAETAITKGVLVKDLEKALEEQEIKSDNP